MTININVQKTVWHQQQLKKINRFSFRAYDLPNHGFLTMYRTRISSGFKLKLNQDKIVDYIYKWSRHHYSSDHYFTWKNWHCRMQSSTLDKIINLFSLPIVWIALSDIMTGSLRESLRIYSRFISLYPTIKLWPQFLAI